MSTRGGAEPSADSRVRRAVAAPGDAAPLYTVSQAADLLDVRPAFLRRLDSAGVVSPMRSPGGQRRYSHREIDHVSAVVVLMGEA